MLNWDNIEKTDEQDDDFLATPNEDGEKPEPAVCPLNPDGLESCEACS